MIHEPVCHTLMWQSPLWEYPWNALGRGPRLMEVSVWAYMLRALEVYPAKSQVPIQVPRRNPSGRVMKETLVWGMALDHMQALASKPAVRRKALCIMYRHSHLCPLPPSERANVRTYVPNLSRQRGYVQGTKVLHVQETHTTQRYLSI